MKIKIELEISTSALHNVTKVTHFMSALAVDLRLKEPELYNYIFNLGVEAAERDAQEYPDCDCYR